MESSTWSFPRHGPVHHSHRSEAHHGASLWMDLARDCQRVARLSDLCYAVLGILPIPQGKITVNYLPEAVYCIIYTCIRIHIGMIYIYIYIYTRTYILCNSLKAITHPLRYEHPKAFCLPFMAGLVSGLCRCETYLGPSGFSVVQISPPTEHVIGDSWSTRAFAFGEVWKESRIESFDPFHFCWKRTSSFFHTLVGRGTDRR